MKSSILFSHNSDDWSTPKELYDFFINHNYIDPCPLYSSVDNLDREYKNQMLFINPPFSKLSQWVDFTIRQYNNDCRIVLLMPSRTDTTYFHRLIEETNCFIVFLKGRLKFGTSNKSAPFPTMLVIIDREIVHDFVGISVDELITKDR